MRIGSLFAGVGGLELGLEWAGVGHTVWQVEREPFCRQVLAKHWPDAVRHDDVMTVGAHNLDPVDVICGGFPCQDISYAGKGAGLAGERSGLWYEYARIVRELAPRFVVVENVSALLTRGLDSVLGTLASLGYDAEWSCVRASDVGARHRRERVFVVAWRTGVADGLGDGRIVGGIGPNTGDVACGVRQARSQGATQAVRATGRSDARDERAAGDAGQAWRLDDADDARLEGRGVRGQQRADERPARAPGCADVAHPRRLSSERRRGSDLVARASGAGQGDGAERERDGHAARGGGAAAGDVEHPDSLGRDRRRGEVEQDAAHDDERRTGSDGDTRPGYARDEAQSGVGRAAHGLSARLDVARPGEAQAEWEAPRVVTQAPYRADRLRALGNAVVPQVAELVGRRLMQIAGCL